MEALRELFDALPEPLRRQALTHASWVEDRAQAYDRLALLGDSVLGLSITSHIWPLLGEHSAGQLTKVRAQTVSGRSCRAVAERLGVPDRLRALAPEESPANEALTHTERVLSQICEAVIAACYLEHGFETTAAAVVDAFAPELEQALSDPGDHKSALQEALAQHGEVVRYEVVGEDGPPHDRIFEMAAIVADVEVARGVGRSKKDAEQAAASAALDTMAR